MINLISYYVLAFVFLVILISCYFLIRGIIWSIAFCNINKKTIRSAEFKKNRNISMAYLSKYICVFHKEYVFWMRFKTCYVIIESFWLFIYLLLPLAIDNLKIPIYFNIIQILIIILIISFQSDTNHNTKFDRYRLNKNKKR